MLLFKLVEIGLAIYKRNALIFKKCTRSVALHFQFFKLFGNKIACSCLQFYVRILICFKMYKDSLFLSLIKFKLKIYIPNCIFFYVIHSYFFLCIKKFYWPKSFIQAVVSVKNGNLSMTGLKPKSINHTCILKNKCREVYVSQIGQHSIKLFSA